MNTGQGKEELGTEILRSVVAQFPEATYGFLAHRKSIEDLENEAKMSEDKAAKAMGEVARLMAELNGSHEATLNADKSRALLAKQVADLQAQLEDAEAAGGKNLKNQIRKLEQRILELESDLDSEGRKAAEIVKQARKADKRVKDMQFQLDDERKANERTASYTIFLENQ